MDIINEATTSLIRSIVITADRYVSSAKNNINIEKIIDNVFFKNVYSQLVLSIDKMVKEFYPDSERSLLQLDAANKLSGISKVSVLNGPTGSVKTKISLQWCAKTDAEKIYYIAPEQLFAKNFMTR